jgi:Family of unknown function (DUF6502)
VNDILHKHDFLPMKRKTPPPQLLRSHDPIKQATVVALRRVVDPVMDLMFDAGITVREFNGLARERAVRVAASRVGKEGGRISKSRVAIITGLARSEVAKILIADDLSIDPPPDQHPARKVLAGWYGNGRFLAGNGDPAILPIYGKRRSFERLVTLYSGGTPVRAMLDQLVQNDAVEILSGQRVKAKSRVPIFRGMTSSAIAMIGDRAADLLETLKGNLRATTKPLFESTAVSTNIDVEAVPLVRKEIADQGAAFIDGANSLFSRSRPKSRRSKLKGPGKIRIGVTVYYFQDDLPGEKFGAPVARKRRKNLQRRLKHSKIPPKTRQ